MLAPGDRVAAAVSGGPDSVYLLHALLELAPRLGFTVTKRVGNAVVRNRTRRRLQEAARLNLAERPLVGVDLVLIGREATRGRDFAALREDLRRALAKVGVA